MDVTMQLAGHKSLYFDKSRHPLELCAHFRQQYKTAHFLAALVNVQGCEQVLA
jgi:hypothetical protein